MLLIIAALFLFQGSAFGDPNSTEIMSRKIINGWDYCSYNEPLKMRCSRDCESLEYCMNGRIFPVSCLQQTGKKYCDMETNSCQDNIGVCYNSRDFCPRDGIFPDLTNCQRYVYCDGEAMHPYECDHGTKWNYKNGKCEDDVDCKTYTSKTGCAGPYYNAIVPHQNPHWFVFCYWGRPLLAECPGRTYTFDQETGNCRFQCEHQENVCDNGKYADENNSTTYYDCYFVKNKWVTKQKTCPAGTEFNEGLQVCTAYGTGGWNPQPVYPESGYRRLYSNGSEEQIEDNDNQSKNVEETETEYFNSGHDNISAEETTQKPEPEDNSQNETVEVSEEVK